MKPLELLLLGDENDNLFDYLPKKICNREIATTCIVRGYIAPDVYFMNCNKEFDEELIRKVVKNGGSIIQNIRNVKAKFYLKPRLFGYACTLKKDQIDTPEKIMSHAQDDYNIIRDTWAIEMQYVDGPEQKAIKEHTINEKYALIIVPNNVRSGITKMQFINPASIHKTIVVHHKKIADYLIPEYLQFGIREFVLRKDITQYLLNRFFDKEKIINHFTNQVKTGNDQNAIASAKDILCEYDGKR